MDSRLEKRAPSQKSKVSKELEVSSQLYIIHN